MKKCFAVLSIVGLFVLVPQLSFAASGSAMIPYYYKDSIHACHLHVTNISGGTVNVKIDLFDVQGNSYTSNTAFFYGFASNPIFSPVALASKNMGALSINTGAAGPGYGRIEWTSSSNNDLKALIAHYHCNSGNVNAQMGIAINNSNPF